MLIYILINKLISLFLSTPKPLPKQTQITNL